MNLLTEHEIANLRMILEAAQSHIGATPPTEIEDDDPDDIQHWRDIDDGLAVLDRLTAGLNDKYVVSMQVLRPVWADERYGAMCWYFQKMSRSESQSLEVPAENIVLVERLHRARIFDSFVAAEVIAAQVGGTVETYVSQYQILEGNVLAGDMKSIECARHISEAKKL